MLFRDGYQRVDGFAETVGTSKAICCRPRPASPFAVMIEHGTENPAMA